MTQYRVRIVQTYEGIWEGENKDDIQEQLDDAQVYENAMLFTHQTVITRVRHATETAIRVTEALHPEELPQSKDRQPYWRQQR